MWRIKDRPALVTGGLIIIAVLYTFAAWLWPAVDFFALLRAPPERLDSVVSLYLGVAGVAAVGAGFAGVVIVFGLDTQSEKFLDFRSDGREPLTRNWMSVIGSSIVSAALAAGAALSVLLEFGRAGTAMFALAVLLIAHALVRMLWLLRVLMRVVAAGDRATRRERNRIDPVQYLHRAS